MAPTHKGGSRALPIQSRPISLTSHIIKTFERVIRKYLVNHMELYDKMDKNQQGSRQKMSCLSQLLEHHSEIIEMLKKGKNVDSIYLGKNPSYHW